MTTRQPAIGLFSMPSNIGSLESLRKGETVRSRLSNGSLAVEDSVNEAREPRGIQISAYGDEQKEKYQAHNFCWSSHKNRQADQGTKSPKAEYDEPADHWISPSLVHARAPQCAGLFNL
jgi:hypothetical protein